MPGNFVETQPIHCPLYTAAEIIPCDPGELQPLLAHLRGGLAASGIRAFPRGTLMEDGRLDLCKQALGPAGCRMVTEALGQNHTVVSLLLGTDGIGNAGAADVARLAEKNPSVEVLYLGCNRISADGVAPLAAALSAAASSVTGLWLKRNPIGPDGAKRLAEMLRTNTSLRTLDLVNTRLGHEGLAALTEALTHSNQTVERLYLGGNFFGPEEAPLLAEIIHRAPNLKALLLNVGFLGDAGAALLASALPESRLEELGLASNGIGPDGAALVFDAAAAHPTLTHLDLGYSVSTRVLGASANALGDAGAAHAARFLAANPILRHLDLRGSGFTGEGTARLADALEHNTHLHSLPLDGKRDLVLQQRLQRNRDTAAGPLSAVCRDVALTRSVYRTAPSKQ